MGGHYGVLCTFKRLSRYFYWPAMHKTIAEYVSQCDTCQRAKAQTMSPAGLLQPLLIPCQVRDDVSMDFVDGLPRSDSHTTIMVVVDRLSKFAHLIPLTHPYTASIIAKKFTETVVKFHGMPRLILSDRDPIFLSNFLEEVLEALGNDNMYVVRIPSSDGRLNGGCE